LKLPDTILLIGNGPNRLSTDDYSWKSIINQLSHLAGKTIDFGNKPLPLVFEELVLIGIFRELKFHKKRYQSMIEINLRNHLASLIKTLKSNSVHSRMINIGFRHILTTNYDYCFENSALNKNNEQTIPAWIENHLYQEKKYSLFRRNLIHTVNGDIFVWHIHGEANIPRSLILGYDQYVNHLNHLINYLSVPNKQKRLDKQELYSPFLQHNTNYENSGSPYSWIDLFLNRDLHIVGLSLDYSEIALWWLLSFKARMYVKNFYVKNNIPIGKTYYYVLYDNLGEIDQQKIHLLESMGVKIININIDRGFEKGYHSLMSELKRKLRSH